MRALAAPLLALAMLVSTGTPAAAQRDPYFGKGPFARAQRLLDQGDPRTAIRLLERLLGETPNAPEAAQARYLLGVGLIETGRYEDAQRIFGELVSTYPALRDDHLFFRGKALYRWGNRLEAASVLAQVDPNGPRGAKARSLRARALYESTDYARLRRWLEGILHAEGRLDSELLYLLGHARHRTGDAFGAHRAFREVWREAPTKPFAGRALAQIAKLRSGGRPVVSEIERSAIAAIESQLTRQADVQGALARLEKNLARRGKGNGLRAQVAYALGRFAETRGRTGAAAQHYARAVSIAPVELAELRARATLANARVLARNGQERQALQLFDLVADRFPQRPEAEEALFLAAQLMMRRREHEGSEARLQRLLLDNPVTPYRARALWGLGWVRFRLGKYKEARQFFASLSRMRLPARLDAASRYWLARTDASLGKIGEARVGFRKLIVRHPLGYYAALAADQLAEVLPVGGGRGGPGVGTASVSVALADVPPALRQISEYTRLGLRRRARVALAAFERARARDRSPLSEAGLHTVAQLYETLGQSLMARRAREEYAREYPHTMSLSAVSAAARRAHPLKYEKEIRAASKEFDIPPALMFALVRTESGFMSQAVSSQKAYGLAQLILPTARQVAGQLRAGRATPKRLLADTAFNVRLGAAYLRGLLNHYDGSELLSLAAYNAGPGAVDSWLSYRVRKLEGHDRKRRGIGLAPSPDELCEEIPVDETRRYVKAVLARARVYARLYTPPAEPLPVTPAGNLPVAVYSEPSDFSDPAVTLSEPLPGIETLTGATLIRDPDEAALYASPGVP